MNIQMNLVSLAFFSIILTSRKMIWHNQVLWRISCCLLLKGCRLWVLWIPFSYSGWHKGYVHKLCSHLKKHLLRKSYWIWSKRPWIHMWFLHWLIVYQPLVHLTFGCLKECMTYLLLLISFQMIGRQNMWWLDCLRWQTLTMKLWFLSSSSY